MKRHVAQTVRDIEDEDVLDEPAPSLLLEPSLFCLCEPAVYLLHLDKDGRQTQAGFLATKVAQVTTPSRGVYTGVLNHKYL